MATTTNYGWTTPDDTALVKDGASAIRTLGTSVDTTTKNLNPETTLGDIAYRSSTSNVNTRLGIGTSGQFLTVSGGVPAWGAVSAGGMTLLSTTTLSGATHIQSISQSYNQLYVVVQNVTLSNNSSHVTLKPNNATTNRYVYQAIRSGPNYNNNGRLDQSIQLTFTNPAWGSGDSRTWACVFSNYAATNSYKPFSIYGAYRENTDPSMEAGHIHGAFLSDTAISSLMFDQANQTGGTVLIYGVK